MEDKRLEQARKEYEMYKNANDVFHCEALERIFPELAESEDEKIKKWLVEQVSETSQEIISLKTTLKKENILAWLEKQGKNDKIIERAKTEKQRVILTESDGNSDIDWDTRSLYDTKIMLEQGLNYINKLFEEEQCKNAEDTHEGGCPCYVPTRWDNIKKSEQKPISNGLKNADQELTEFEKRLSQVISWGISSAIVSPTEDLNRFAKSYAKELFSLAKKELLDKVNINKMATDYHPYPYERKIGYRDGIADTLNKIKRE